MRFWSRSTSEGSLMHAYMNVYTYVCVFVCSNILISLFCVPVHWKFYSFRTIHQILSKWTCIDCVFTHLPYEMVHHLFQIAAVSNTDIWQIMCISRRITFDMIVRHWGCNKIDCVCMCDCLCLLIYSMQHRILRSCVCVYVCECRLKCNRNM